MTMDVVQIISGDIDAAAFDNTFVLLMSDTEQNIYRFPHHQPFHLTTVDQVIEALGGMGKLLKLTDANNKQVWFWRHKNQFPAYLFWCMTTALGERGYTAPVSLWHQHQPKYLQ